MYGPRVVNVHEVHENVYALTVAERRAGAEMRHPMCVCVCVAGSQERPWEVAGAFDATGVMLRLFD